MTDSVYRLILVSSGSSDSGTRHHSRFWNDDYLEKEGIPVRHDIDFILNTADDQPDYSS